MVSAGGGSAPSGMNAAPTNLTDSLLACISVLRRPRPMMVRPYLNDIAQYSEEAWYDMRVMLSRLLKPILQNGPVRICLGQS